MAIWEGERNQLTSRILPKERVLMKFAVRPPPDPGEYLLCLDLVHEGFGWFGIDKELAVNIEPSLRDQLCCGEADLIPVSSARAARRRLRQADGLAKAMQPEQNQRQESSQGLTFGGWSLDEVVMDYVTARIRKEKLFRVLEFGSGVSTVAIARELAAVGGVILSVDDSPAYANQTRKMLADRGLEAHASVIIANLVTTTTGGVPTLCYDFSAGLERAIKELDPDLVVIDGPSQAANASRLAIAPLVARLIRRSTPFVMDDAFRDAELEIGHRWQNDAHIRVSGIAAIGKGLLVGQLDGSPDTGETNPSVDFKRP
jgi:predicted O-methyltransferase YrrM